MLHRRCVARWSRDAHAEGRLPELLLRGADFMVQGGVERVVGREEEVLVRVDDTAGVHVRRETEPRERESCPKRAPDLGLDPLHAMPHNLARRPIECVPKEDRVFMRLMHDTRLPAEREARNELIIHCAPSSSSSPIRISAGGTRESRWGVVIPRARPAPSFRTACLSTGS